MTVMGATTAINAGLDMACLRFLRAAPHLVRGPAPSCSLGAPSDAALLLFQPSILSSGCILYFISTIDTPNLGLAIGVLVWARE